MTAFAELIAEFEQFPELLSTTIKDLDSERLLHKPNGKWSIQEHAGHLLAIESLWIARLDDFMLKHEVLRPWNGTNEETDQAQFNLQKLHRILSDFEQIRSGHSRMIKLSEQQLKEVKCLHPRTQMVVSFEDHLKMMVHHDKQHLQIIKDRLV